MIPSKNRQNHHSNHHWHHCSFYLISWLLPAWLSVCFHMKVTWWTVQTDLSSVFRLSFNAANFQCVGEKNILWHCTLELLLLLLLPLFPTQIIHLMLHNIECVSWKKCILLHSMEICLNGLCNKLSTFMLLFPVKGIRFSLCWVFIIILGICDTLGLNEEIECGPWRGMTNLYHGLDAIGGLQWIYWLDRKIIWVRMWEAGGQEERKWKVVFFLLQGFTLEWRI